MAPEIGEKDKDGLSKSQVVEGAESARTSKKFGSLKFKISFMRGKYFQEGQLSRVLNTQEEVERKAKMALSQTSPIKIRKTDL